MKLITGVFLNMVGMYLCLMLLRLVSLFETDIFRPFAVPFTVG